MINFIVLLVLAVSLSIALLIQLKTNSAPQINSKEVLITIKDSRYSLEVAATPVSRQKGLMNRPNLPENSGMLFVFESQSIYPFWMKNTLIPLDIIWLNEKKEIVHIKENAQPCKNIIQAICRSIIPLKPALYVIELNAGEVQKLGLKTGDSISFQL